jgi:hypothetical protein
MIDDQYGLLPKNIVAEDAGSTRPTRLMIFGRRRA